MAITKLARAWSCFTCCSRLLILTLKIVTLPTMTEKTPRGQVQSHFVKHLACYIPVVKHHMTTQANNKPQASCALVLSGGGARAAYQVGALRGISSVLGKDHPNPFGIIAGTSAGALNAAGIATHAHRFRTGIRMLEYVWRNISSDQ